MQEIVRQLLFMGQAVPEKDQVELGNISPWLDNRFGPIDEVIATLEGQQHRRFIKTHLPLDGLPFYLQVKYIVVGRDARDVAMSMWNHHANYTAGALAFMQNFPGRVGDALPPATNLHEFWREWIGRGWFAWESEGYPYCLLPYRKDVR
jgi:aryl sulfotransferase